MVPVPPVAEVVIAPVDPPTQIGEGLIGCSVICGSSTTETNITFEIPLSQPFAVALLTQRKNVEAVRLL